MYCVGNYRPVWSSQQQMLFLLSASIQRTSCSVVPEPSDNDSKPSGERVLKQASARWTVTLGAIGPGVRWVSSPYTYTDQ